jgi:hypothetical protein
MVRITINHLKDMSETEIEVDGAAYEILGELSYSIDKLLTQLGIEVDCDRNNMLDDIYKVIKSKWNKNKEA